MEFYAVSAIFQPCNGGVKPPNYFTYKIKYHMYNQLSKNIVEIICWENNVGPLSNCTVGLYWPNGLFIR